MRAPPCTRAQDGSEAEDEKRGRSGFQMLLESLSARIPFYGDLEQWKAMGREQGTKRRALRRLVSVRKEMVGGGSQLIVPSLLVLGSTGQLDCHGPVPDTDTREEAGWWASVCGRT